MQRDFFTYSAYGLSISSSFEFPELPGLPEFTGSGESGADVIISFGAVEEDPEGGTAAGENSVVTKEGVYFSWDGIGRFFVDNEGSEVVIDPAPDVEVSTLRHLVLGVIMGTVLHQRGELVLHASSVVISAQSGDGLKTAGAVVFMGDAGWGKSTVAAAFHVGGDNLVTDDVAAVRVINDDDRGGATATVTPGAPLMKLWPETARALGYDYKTCLKVNPEYEKRIIPARERFANTPAPLKRLYVLDEGEELSITPIEGQAAFMELVRNTFCVNLFKSTDASSHFLRSAALASAAPVSRLSIPTNLRAMTEVVAMVKEDLARDLFKKTL